MEHTPRGRAADRRMVAGQQEHEVAYVAKKTSAGKEAVQAAVGKARHSRASVMKELGNGRKPAKRAG